MLPTQDAERLRTRSLPRCGSILLLIGALALAPLMAIAQQPDAQGVPVTQPAAGPAQDQATTAPVDCSADPDQSSCPTPLSRSLKAIQAYVTAPVRWDRNDWLLFGGSLAAIGVAHHFDATVRTHFAGDTPASVGSGSPDTVQDALPAAALFLGTWGYANLIGDDDGRHEAHSMLEAGALSVATAYVIGYAARREGPNQTTDPDRWETSGGTSFPSEHATLAFAIGTVFAESGNGRYRWVRRVLGYGVAGFTAYERLHHNAHWLSDTVAGAALGAASARFSMNRRAAAESHGTLALQPISRGVMLTYSLHLP